MLGSTVVADIHLHVAHFAHHAVRVWAGEHVDALAMRQHVRVGAIRRRGDVNVLIGGKDRREKEDEEGQRQDFHGRSSHRCVGTVQGCLSERGRASEEGGREEGKVIVGQWGSGAVGQLALASRHVRGRSTHQPSSTLPPWQWQKPCPGG